MTIFFDLTSVVVWSDEPSPALPLSSAVTATVKTPSFAGPVRRPCPRTTVILFFFIKKSRPLVCLVMISFLRPSRFCQLSFGWSTPSIPYLPACFRWSQISAENSIALVGMQPQWRHVPPSRSVFSIRATFKPYCAARMAHV